MELCDADLKRFIEESGDLDDGQCLDIILQITNGVQFIHHNKIIHRDLKPANVLVKRNTPNIFKIADFGLSKFL